MQDFFRRFEGLEPRLLTWALHDQRGGRFHPPDHLWTDSRPAEDGPGQGRNQQEEKTERQRRAGYRPVRWLQAQPQPQLRNSAVISLRMDQRYDLLTALTLASSWTAGPETATRWERFWATERRDSTSPSTTRAPASLGASAAPRKADSAVDTSEEAIPASPDIALQFVEKRGKKRSRAEREDVTSKAGV